MKSKDLLPSGSEEHDILTFGRLREEYFKDLLPSGSKGHDILMHGRLREEYFKDLLPSRSEGHDIWEIQRGILHAIHLW